MSTTQRIVRKQLAGAEDLLRGVGTVTQTRGSGTYTIHKLDVPVPVSSEAEMLASGEEFVRAYTTDLEYTDYRKNSSGTYYKTWSAEHRAALARQVAEAGYNLVSGSCEEGATLTSSNDVVWYQTTDTIWQPNSYPQTVQTDFIPSAPDWLDRTTVQLSAPVTVPDSATSTGLKGQWAVDADYLYICIAVNSWKRVNITTWQAPNANYTCCKWNIHPGVPLRRDIP